VSLAMLELHLLSAEEVEARVAWPKDQANPSRGGGATSSATAANEEEPDEEEEPDNDEDRGPMMIPPLGARMMSHEMHLELIDNSPLHDLFCE